MTPESRRIVELPVAEPLSWEEAESLSRQVLAAAPFEGECPIPDCHTCYPQDPDDPTRRLVAPLRLRIQQASALASFRRHLRGFWSMEVGSGKSATAILVAQEVFGDPKCSEARILLLLPAGTTQQFWERDLPWSRTHLAGWVPDWISLYRQPASVRRAMATSGRPGVYVVPYSLLSEPDARGILEAIDADLVIADEGQFLRGKSARTRRFWDWIRGFDRRKEERPLGVAMSGTLQTSSPKDYARLIAWTLDDLSPLPRGVMEVDVWAGALRSRAEERQETLSTEQFHALNPVMRWARRRFPEEARPRHDDSVQAARAAYRLRFRSCPGIVPMGDEEDPIPLEVRNVDPGSPNEKLQKMLDDLDQSWLTPDGRVLKWTVEKHEVQRQLTAGFWLRRYWPDRHPKLDLVKRSWARHEEYAVELRRFLRSSDSGRLQLDTPRQVGQHHRQHGALPDWEDMHDLWVAWKELDRQLAPSEKPDKVMLTSFELVDDYKVQKAVEWAEVVARPGGIVWVEHDLLGDEVYRRLQGRVRVMRKREGDPWMPRDGSAEFVVVANRKAHGYGKNLQYDHRHQLLLEWVRGAGAMEQLLGRLHRFGQSARKLRVHTFHVTEFDHLQVAATLWDTVFDVQTMGGTRKLLLASWVPEPKEYPPDFLTERGFKLRGA